MRFNNKRFVTRGVNEKLNLNLQLFLWSCIDNLPPEQDYLQVFKFTANKDGIKIIHTQEIPEYHQEYVLGKNIHFFVGKIYVIDDNTHSTMLLAEEY